MAINGERSGRFVGLGIFILLVLAGCGTTESVTVRYEVSDAQVARQAQPLPDQGRPYNIPLEYMPPPGKCRIWLPGRPPEHQPPPGECADLERCVPLNTWLLHGAEE